MDEQVAMFMDITSVTDPTVATNFIDMSGGNLETAVGLYFEHGSSMAGGNNQTTNIDQEENVNKTGSNDDFELANRLQREMYEQQDEQEEIRQPIMPTHDTLLPQEYGYGGMPMSMGMGHVGPEGGMFGRSQRSVFNQTAADNANHVVVLDSDDEYDNDDEITGTYDFNGSGVRSTANINSRMTSTQKRLANIFRPPWDIISKVDLKTAKGMAREQHKWILVNIQDVTDFRCQCLNRDFWSSQQIKELVEHNFIFLQYHHDSPSGEMYRNLYPFDDEYPHIAILDPITGERMMVWRTNPEVHNFIERVVDFLTRYSVDETSSKVAPTSVGLNKSNAISLDDTVEDEEEENEEEENEEEEDEQEEDYDSGIDDDILNDGEAPAREVTYAEKINALNATDIEDPPNDTEPALTTRIQIRSGIDGKRIVKKFMLDDPVKRVFEYTKFAFADSLNGRPFTLKMQRINLADAFSENQTIKESQLQNASVLLEVLDEDEE